MTKARGDSGGTATRGLVGAGGAGTMPAGMIVEGRFEVVGLYDHVSQRGNMLTYAAVDRETGAEVLLCRLKTALARDAAVRGSVEFGLARLRPLAHAGIIRVVAVAHDAGEVLFVTEKIEGRSLSRLLREGAIFTESEVVTTGRNLLEALAFAHAAGVAFGNVKASHLILEATRERAVMVCLPRPPFEFSSIPQLAAYLGVPHDSAPEVLRDGRFDAPADIYGAGMVLYEMCTGKLPFKRFANLGDVIAHIVDEGLPPPSSLNPAIPPRLDQIITRAVARDPAARFASAGEMLDELRRLQPRSTPLLSRPRLIELVAEAYPQPLAQACAAIDLVSDENDQLQRLVDAVQVALQFLATIALAERAASARKPFGETGSAEPAAAEFSRPSLGHWAGWLRESARDHGFVVVPELSRLLWDERVRAQATVRELDALVSLRNEVRHGVSVPRAASRKRLAEFRPRLEGLLSEANFLRRYRLVVAESLEFQRDEFACRLRVFRGASRDPIMTTVRLPQPLHKDRVYFADANYQRILDLYPLIIYAPCPLCDEEEIFFYESAGDERIHYRSFHKGHALASDVELPDFQERGYL